MDGKFLKMEKKKNYFIPKATRNKARISTITNQHYVILSWRY